MNKRRTTSIDYAHPHRPLLLRALNAVGGAAHRAGLAIDLSADSLMQAAIRAERATDFGDGDFVTPLRVLTAAIEEEADLHFTGRFITRQRLINLLRNRLRAARFLARHPEVRDMPLPPVILVTGLQRTGTTLLHRLLSAREGQRGLRSFEALNPVPFGDDPAVDRRQKLRLARTAEAALSFMAPDFFAIHPVEAEQEEEDVLLLDYALISTVAESTMNVPTYAQWVETHDNRPAYEYMATLLRILSFFTGPSRWILKSPHHLEFLDVFLDVFKDATVVWAHRDPCETLPSFCSMMCHGRGVFSDAVDPVAIGDQWLRKTARMVQRGMAVRAARPDGRFVDVDYNALVGDPMGPLTRICEVAGLPVTRAVQDRFRETLRDNRQHRYGIHRYDMASFGLTPERIYTAYGDYGRRFGHKDGK